MIRDLTRLLACQRAQGPSWKLPRHPVTGLRLALETGRVGAPRVRLDEAEDASLKFGRSLYDVIPKASYQIMHTPVSPHPNA